MFCCACAGPGPIFLLRKQNKIDFKIVLNIVAVALLIVCVKIGKFPDGIPSVLIESGIKGPDTIGSRAF